MDAKELFLDQHAAVHGPNRLNLFERGVTQIGRSGAEPPGT